MHTYDDKTIERFWSKVDKRGPDDCWPWKGATGQSGYGQLRRTSSRKLVCTHRMAIEIATDTNLDSLWALHKCDNPPCCNPKHLYAGTRSDNMRDVVERHRIKPRDQRGEKGGRAKITNDDVRLIVKMIRDGLNNKEIAKVFGLTHSMISAIRLKKAWSHIPEVQSLPSYHYGKVIAEYSSEEER